MESPTLFSDRINMPFTFITTCGYEYYQEVNSEQEIVSSNVMNRILSKTDTRLDFIYLYDLPASATPQDLVQDSESYELPGEKAAVVATIHPWGHYVPYSGYRSFNKNNTALHMPGSYGYLMAYANSIKNNKPWLAVAGVNRGIIPNIRAIDYDFQEPYVHALQGDPLNAYDTSTIFNDNPVYYRVNPIVNFGPTFGKIIFGNRTYFIGNNVNALSFRSFLNVRLLLANIHKAAFNSSIQHTFEPNDDIVWLSFKQKVNDLLDQMVSGRGIKWYKWYKLQSDHLGQIKAKLTIRPIEAVESFDITISMTDEDIEVAEE